MREMDKIKLPAKLRANILTRIGREEFRRARIYLFASATVGAVGVFGALLSIKYMLQGLSQSGFYNYFSLLISDPDMMLTYWREFALSIVESAPFIGITILLAAIAVLMFSARIFANNMRHGFTPVFKNSY
jgi:hypothetical protein